MKIISGLYQPDVGNIIINNSWFSDASVEDTKTINAFSDPRESIQLGIGMVYQHFQLVEPFTVAENITLGNEILSKFGILLGQKTIY